MKELNYKADYISLNIIDDGEGNPLCSIKLDDEQELVVTQYELLNLKLLLDKHIDEIQSYFDIVNNLDTCAICGHTIEEGRARQDIDERIICEDCFMDKIIERGNLAHRINY